MTPKTQAQELAEKIHDDSGCECTYLGKREHIEWFAEIIQKIQADERERCAKIVEEGMPDGSVLRCGFTTESIIKAFQEWLAQAIQEQK